MHLRSPAFQDGEEIPRKYTHDGQGVSPPLEWDDVPSAAKSLALIVEDPDAPDPEKPQGLWIHWVVVDLPPTSTGLPEAVGALPAGVILKLYALDRELHLEKPTKYLLDRVIANEVVLAEAKLVVTYQSRNRA